MAQPGPSPPTDPVFLHPEPFRPNSYFVGREAELASLHSMLMDRVRRAEGTSAVLVQSLPGGGKTHLAREYVFRHRFDYPGGVFWVRAKSIVEMEQFFVRSQALFVPKTSPTPLPPRQRREAMIGSVDRRRGSGG